jgi:hypothetical protein
MPFNIQIVHSEENPELIIMYPTLIQYWKQNVLYTYFGTYILGLFKNKPHIVDDLKSNITDKIASILAAMPSATSANVKHHVHISAHDRKPLVVFSLT